ncbi:MAG TPA: hypothetical protein VF509_00410 [Sphingobium sp.]
MSAIVNIPPGVKSKTSMSESKVYGKPGKAAAEEGQVLLDGPDGIAISLTPFAAEETGKELLRAAAEARLQIS